jgi:hypothetical protein
MAKWLLAPFIAVTLVVAACTTAPPLPRTAVTGSGTTATEVRTVSGFTEIFVSGPSDVNIRQDGTETLSIEAEANLLPYLQSRQSGRVLTLGPESGVAVQATRPIRYTLTVRQLSAVRMNGAGSIRADGLNTELLEVTLNGGARAELQGTASRQEVLVAGAADYRADRLTSKHADVEINGAGTAFLNASDQLEATINGAGTVEYVGSPRVTQTINGLGTVRRRG